MHDQPSFESSQSLIDNLEQEINIYKHLSETQPALYEPRLAETLEMLAEAFYDLGEVAKACDTSQRAVSCYERMVKREPQVYALKLAATLSMSASYLIELKEKKKAYSLLERVLSLYEGFAKENSRFHEYVAPVLLNLSLIDDTSQGQKSLERSLLSYEVLARENPQLYEKVFSSIVFGLYRYEQYEPAQIRDSLKLVSDILQRLSQEHPDIYQQHSATTLNLLGNVLSQLDELNNTCDCHERALSIYENLSQSQPGKWDTDTVNTLNSLVLVNDELNKLDDASRYCKRALAICKHPSNRKSWSFEPLLAMTLANFGLIRWHQKKLSESLKFHQEALGIFEKLTKHEPFKYQAKLALTLFNTGEVEFESKKLKEAREYYERALSIYEEINQRKHETHSDDIAFVAHRLGDVLAATGNLSDALSHYVLALDFYAKMNPKKRSHYMETALHRLLECSHRFGGREQTLTALNKVQEIYTTLAKDFPLEFEPNVARISSLLKRLSHEKIQPTSYSYIEEEPITCPNCGLTFEMDLCLIMDVSERPDLFERFREEKIHDYTCPGCGATNRRDAPLLLYRPNDDPVLIFIPARETSAEQDQGHAQFLLNHLRNTLGGIWNAQWLNPLTRVSHEMSRFVFSDEASSFQIMEVESLSQAILEFANTTQWEEARQLVNIHPNLLTPLADKILTKLIAEEEEIDEKLKAEEARQVLRRCRQVGIDDAFSQKRDLIKGDVTTYDIVRAIQDFLDASTWEEAKEVISRYGERLLCPLAEQILVHTKNKLSHFEDGSIYFEQHRQILEKARVQGIETAFVGFTGAKEDPIKALDPVKAFLHASSWEDSKAAVKLHQDRLLNENTERQLVETSEQLRPLDKEGADFIDQHRQILAKARLQGIEEAFMGLTGGKENPFQATNLPQEQLLSYKDKEVLEIVSRDIVLYERSKFTDLVNNSQSNIPQQIWDLMEGAFNKARSPKYRIRSCDEFIKHVDPNEFPVMWSTFRLHSAHLLTENERSDEYGQNVELAILSCREVIEHLEKLDNPQFQGIWGQALLYLGEAHRQRTLGNKRDNKELAISLYRQALSVFTRDLTPKMWAVAHHYLGCAFDERVEGSASDNIEQAISHYNLALEIRTKDSVREEWVITTNNLANAYSHRILGDAAENIERSIALYKSALTAVSPAMQPMEYARIQNDLGLALKARLVGNFSDNIREAIACHERALDVWSREDIFAMDWAKAQASLGIDYLLLKDLDGKYAAEAIKHLNSSLKIITLENHPDFWATIHHNLGAAYLECSKSGKDQNNALGIEHMRMALKYYTKISEPSRWGASQIILGLLYAQRKDDDSYQIAVDCFQNSLSVINFSEHPHWYLNSARNLGKIYFENYDWCKAASVYKDAWRVIQHLYDMNATDVSRQEVIKGGSKIVANGVYSLARLGRFIEAVEWLELNRTRAVTEMLNRDSAALEMVTMQDREEFITTLNHLKKLEAGTRQKDLMLTEADDSKTFEAHFGELREVRDSFTSIANRIRSYLPDFMPSASQLSEIAAVADCKSPIVYIATTSQGSIAIVVPHNVTELVADHVLWLDGFDVNMLNQLLLESDETGEYVSGYLIGQMVPEAALTYFRDDGFLDVLLATLRTQLMASLAKHVNRLGFSKMTLVPCGKLSLLPLHAAVLDIISVNYIPSARLLMHADTGTAKQLAKIHPVLLAVANPLPQATELTFAKSEIEAIQSFFPANYRRVLVDYEGKRDNVVQMLPGATHLHFACHGAFDFRNPLLSGLSLASEEKITLRDLLDGQIDLSTLSMVVLSACSTGVVSAELPDEAIGLSAGFLYAGVTGVISTLWPVNDLSTAMLMKKFYELSFEEGLEASEALQGAQQWLRSASVRQLELVQHCEKAYISSRNSDSVALSLSLLRLLRYYQTIIDEIPFAHPYYWAGFKFTGTV